jgi:signal transduction histidine kinase
MQHSFGESYYEEIQQTQQYGEHTNNDTNELNDIATIAGDIILKRFKNDLININLLLLFIVPLLSFYLTRKTLKPMQLSYEQQKQFISDVSHELRTPLAIMSGETSFALKTDKSIGEYKMVLQSIDQEINRLTELIENLLLLSRLEKRDFAFKSDPVDLVDLLVDVIMALKSESIKKNIIVNLTPPENKIIVRGNYFLLRQLFFNILDNAIKYNNFNGQVELDFIYQGDLVLISIADNGIGIKEKELKKVFDRFWRDDRSRSMTKGYGLGLSICKNILKIQNGKIEIKSKENKGTIVKIYLSIYS